MNWSALGFAVGVALLAAVLWSILERLLGASHVAAIVTVEITAVVERKVTARCLTNEYNDEQDEHPLFRFLFRPHPSQLQVGQEYTFRVRWQSAGQELPQPGQEIKLGETYSVLIPRHFWCYAANDMGTAGFALEQPRIVRHAG